MIIIIIMKTKVKCLFLLILNYQLITPFLN